MPITLVDPATQPQGSAGMPVSPLAGAMSGLIGAYGEQFPTSVERAQMEENQAQTANIKQRMAAGSQLGDTIASALSDPGATGDAMRAALPHIVQYATEGGDMGQAGRLARLLVANMKGTPGDIAHATVNTPTTLDLSQIGSGEGVAATNYGARKANVEETGRQTALAKLNNELGNTAEQKNQRRKIQMVMEANPGMTESQATNIVLGVVEGGRDPITSQPYIINKGDLLMKGEGSGPPLPPVANTPIPEPLTAKPSDVNVDSKQAYGSAGLMNTAQGMFDAITNSDSKSSAQTENASLNNMKSDYLAIAESRGRQSDKSRGLITNALPPSGNIFDPTATVEKAFTSPGTAQEMQAKAMSKVLSWRDQAERDANDASLNPQARKEAQDTILKADKYIKDYGSPDLQSRYKARYAPPATNLERGMQATTTAKTPEQVPVGKSGMPAPRTAQERDLLPPGAQYEAPDGSIRTKGR